MENIVAPSSSEKAPATPEAAPTDTGRISRTVRRVPFEFGPMPLSHPSFSLHLRLVNREGLTGTWGEKIKNPAKRMQLGCNL